MKNKLLLAAACIVLFSACESTPDRSNYYHWNEGVVLGEDTPLLQGTIWTMTNLGSGYTETIEFRPGGTLVSTGTQGNNTWKRSGTTVEMLFNDGYACCIGTGDFETPRISGTGENVNGAKWEFIMTLSSVEMMQMDAQQKAYERQEAAQRSQEILEESNKKIQDSMKDIQDQMKQFQQDIYDKKY